MDIITVIVATFGPLAALLVAYLKDRSERERTAETMATVQMDILELELILKTAINLAQYISALPIDPVQRQQLLTATLTSIDAILIAPTPKPPKTA